MGRNNVMRALQARAVQSAANRVQPRVQPPPVNGTTNARSAVNGTSGSRRPSVWSSSGSWTNVAPRDWGNGNPSSSWTKPRHIPINLRQSGDGGMMESMRAGVPHDGMRLCLEARIRKSPFFHLAQEAGCWAYAVYNKHFLAKAYADPAEGGLIKEYEWLTEHVTMWDVAIERQVRVRGPDAEEFVNRLITRRVTDADIGKGKYVILCNEAGGILNDPVLLRISKDEFWFSLADSDIGMYLQGVNVGMMLDVDICEIDVAPVQIQGPKSTAMMVDAVGPEIEDVPYYGLLHTTIGGCPVVISRTGFSAERGYEVYLIDATLNAEKMWYALLKAGEAHNLRVTSTSHIRRIEAGILSYGQDIDIETNPYEVNLGWQVDLSKEYFVGKEALARIKKDGVTHKLCGIKFNGDPITWYPSDMYTCNNWSGELIGHLTSAFYSPAVGCNVGFAYLPVQFGGLGNTVEVVLPAMYNTSGEIISGEICKTPFKMPGKEEQGTVLRTLGSKL